MGAALALASACSMKSGGGNASPASPVVAEVNGRKITLSELDERIASQLYEVRSEALDELVQEIVLETEAEKRGLTPAELVSQETAARGAVTDADVEAFFEENKARMRPDETLEKAGPQIRRYLVQQRSAKAQSALRKSADVALKLEAPRVQVSSTGPSLGPDDAPITIVEFSDYQCPFCSRAEPLIQQVLAKYPDSVRLVYRHFPLDSIHPNARPASIAAVCAEEQNQFWAFHEKVFANQRALGAENLIRFAEELELDLEAFNLCRAGDAAAARVAADVAAGEAAGTTGTPAFYVNGIKLSGARPLEAFVEVIERELDRSS
jgi:protein-disulfide isomerase